MLITYYKTNRSFHLPCRVTKLSKAENLSSIWQHYRFVAAIFHSEHHRRGLINKYTWWWWCTLCMTYVSFLQIIWDKTLNIFHMLQQFSNAPALWKRFLANKLVWMCSLDLRRMKLMGGACDVRLCLGRKWIRYYKKIQLLSN